MITRDQRNGSLFHQRLGRALATHGADRFHRWTDEDDAIRGTCLSELFVFREKAVAGMYGLRTGLFRRVEDAFDIEITFARGRQSDQYRFVCEARMARIGIGFGEHRHSANAQATRRLDNPAGDLAAIGNEDFLEHGVSPLSSWECVCRETRRCPLSLRLSHAVAQCAAPCLPLRRHRGNGERRRESIPSLPFAPWARR